MKLYFPMHAKFCDHQLVDIFCIFIVLFLVVQSHFHYAKTVPSS